MRKTIFWKADWFAILLVALFFLFSANSDLMQSMERKAYDLAVRATTHSPSDKIAIIAIDDESIANLRSLAMAARGSCQNAGYPRQRSSQGNRLFGTVL